MNKFIEKHADKLTGVLSCFDRVLFKGYLDISYPAGMMALLDKHGILIKDFGPFAEDQARRLKEHAMTMAQHSGRPFLYLARHVRKEDLVNQILRQTPTDRGLVCVLSAVELCQGFKIARGEKGPRLVSASRKCLFLYYYFLDPELGLFHIRIQTWFPFTIQVCVNGHSWLARKMDRHHVGYETLDNAFARIEQVERAQQFADKFPTVHWDRILNAFARRICPLFKDLLTGKEYYWVTDQAEYATDLIFKDRDCLKDLYQNLLRHASLSLSAEDILGFLGKKLHGCFKGEVLTESKKRWPGARVKHRIKDNWIKMYDKRGLVLRIETVINDPHEFMIYRKGIRQGQEVMGWYPMAKGVANLYRYAQICGGSNHRYLEALAVVDDPSPAMAIMDKACQPAEHRGRRRRGLNPLGKDDQALFRAVLRGEHVIRGFRNADIAQHLLPRISQDPAERRRQTASVTRRIQLLRAHKMIAKIPRTRRYRLTAQGTAFMAAAIRIREQELPHAIKQLAS